MQSLIESRFRAWTQDLDTRQAMISIFEHIRDIPYSLAVPLRDPVTGPEEMLRIGKGYCGPKHHLLAGMFRRLGFDVVFASFPFLWNDPDLQYPAGLRELSVYVPVSHHLACRVKIDTRWVLVDATWDPPLARGGFSVNESWDGRSDTRCAVKPLRSPVRTAFCRTLTTEPYRTKDEVGISRIDGEHICREGGDPGRGPSTTAPVCSAGDLERISRFYREFEEWLIRVRRKDLLLS